MFILFRKFGRFSRHYDNTYAKDQKRSRLKPAENGSQKWAYKKVGYPFLRSHGKPSDQKTYDNYEIQSNICILQKIS